MTRLSTKTHPSRSSCSDVLESPWQVQGRWASDCQQALGRAPTDPLMVVLESFFQVLCLLLQSPHLLGTGYKLGIQTQGTDLSAGICTGDLWTCNWTLAAASSFSEGVSRNLLMLLSGALVLSNADGAIL